MSEGIQGNTSRQPSYQNQQQQHQSAASTNENSAERETAESQQLLRGPARSFVASPGVGALLVEAYAKVVLKKQNRLSPNKVLFEYARFLVSSFGCSASFANILRFLFSPCLAFLRIPLQTAKDCLTCTFFFASTYTTVPL